MICPDRPWSTSVALVAKFIIIGNLLPEAQGNISYININPWDEVAVPTLEPVAEAAQHTARAECSDSTLTKRAFNSPLETKSAIFSTTGLWGVIG
jgi:hypothetical protein